MNIYSRAGLKPAFVVFRMTFFIENGNRDTRT